MTEAPRGERAPPEQHEGAAGYATDLSKQFLSFAVAGIGFIVGLRLTGKAAVSATAGWALPLLLGASAMCGLGFFMNLIHEVRATNDHDPSRGSLRALATLQVVLFLAAVVWLYVEVMGSTPTSAPGAASTLVVRDAHSSMTHPIPVGADVQILREPSGDLTVTVTRRP